MWNHEEHEEKPSPPEIQKLKLSDRRLWKRNRRTCVCAHVSRWTGRSGSDEERAEEDGRRHRSGWRCFGLRVEDERRFYDRHLVRKRISNVRGVQRYLESDRRSQLLVSQLKGRNVNGAATIGWIHDIGAAAWIFLGHGREVGIRRLAARMMQDIDADRQSEIDDQERYGEDSLHECNVRFTADGYNVYRTAVGRRRFRSCKRRSPRGSPRASVLHLSSWILHPLTEMYFAASQHSHGPPALFPPTYFMRTILFVLTNRAPSAPMASIRKK